MTIKTSTLRPGLLVSLKTSVTGNVSYVKTDIEEGHKTATGEEIAKWETVRTISDLKEHEAAQKTRTQVRGCLLKVCTNTAFGLLCPEANSDELEVAIAKARAAAEDFNSTATITRLQVYVITGRIAADDVEAAKAISSEVRDLLATMEEGVKKFDVTLIRKAALEAKSIGKMLSSDAQARIQIAIDKVRETAKDIVKAGEAAAKEVDMTTLRTLAEARTAFLDLDDHKPIAKPVEAGRALDLETA